MGRLGAADECVGAFLCLASESLSSYVTGQIIEVNGGQLMPQAPGRPMAARRCTGPARGATAIVCIASCAYTHRQGRRQQLAGEERHP